MAAGRRLFTERGYANVSAADLVAAAGLTRGALYHHYADKQDLFRAVFVELEVELNAELRAAVDAAPDVLTGMITSLDAFLTACERDEVVRIGLTDAPAVLGWDTWRAIENEHGLGLLTEMLESGMRDGLLIAQPVRVLAQLILSAVIEGALLVASAEDRGVARGEVRQGMVSLLAGLIAPPSRE
ncbi:MAG TPA: helix-turn-helix domain-containing protein [Pseudonocardiaceae bacterium]|jgi:AcrR family transcriptional regulator|nr:helix-turn-helix domain-containing protein [Pseudonocardiaceae bacterium]